VDQAISGHRLIVVGIQRTREGWLLAVAGVRQPGERRFPFPSASDDVGTSYRLYTGSAGGTGRLVSVQCEYQPAIPDEATTITLDFSGGRGEVTAIAVNLGTSADHEADVTNTPDLRWAGPGAVQREAEASAASYLLAGARNLGISARGPEPADIVALLRQAADKLKADGIPVEAISGRTSYLDGRPLHTLDFFWHEESD
jgi:hypothetical protein